MPLIFISDERQNSLELEPYASINKKIDDFKDEIDGQSIKYAISRHKSGFYEGFDIDRFYCDDIILRFAFSRNKQAMKLNEEILIHHTIEYEFDSDFLDIQYEAANAIKKRVEYVYIPNVSYLEYSYNIEKNNVLIAFDVLTKEEDVKSVVDQLISQDILIFSRGW